MHKTTQNGALILADMEGITGIFSKRQCKPNTQQWWHARHHVTEDVNCAVRGLRQRGMHPIYINDMHASGFNLLPEKIGGAAQCRQGQFWSPVPLFGRIPEARCALMIGWHAGPDQLDAFSPHIFDRRVRWLKINGRLVTEVELFAAVLGEHGIPVTFLTGEQAMIDRVRGNMPWIQAFSIPKRQLSREQAAHIRRELEHRIAHHLNNVHTAPPYVLGPHRVDIKLHHTVHRWQADSARQSYRRILLNSVFGSYPAVLLPVLLWIYRARCRYLYNKRPPLGGATS